MPNGLNGAELAREALRLQPQLKVLVTSGYARQASSNADDLKDAVLRCNPPASLFCSWPLHLDRKKSPIVLNKDAFPPLCNLCKDRSCIREELIKCNRL